MSATATPAGSKSSWPAQGVGPLGCRAPRGRRQSDPSSQRVHRSPGTSAYDGRMRAAWVLSLCLVPLVIATPQAGASHLGPAETPEPILLAQAPSVKEIVDGLSLREKIGQLLMSGVSDRYLTRAERDSIKKYHLGGVIMFGHNYSDRLQMERFTSQIQSAARRGNSIQAGALVSVDQEGGVVKRFPDMPPRYSAPEMGRIGDTSVAFDQGRAIGRALRSVGVNVNLAPVADIDLAPHVMRDRSFGSDRYVVGRLAKAFAQGLQRPDVAAAAKHFPGLGGATRNSDYGPSYVYRSKWQIRNIDAVPFKRAIAGGIRMIMVGHAMYPNDGGRTPASLSWHITTGRLRRDLGFKGVAISDAIEAISWRFGGDVVKTCKRSVQVGIDVALLTSSPVVAGQCAQRIYKAVQNGTIKKNRIDQGARRVLKLKEWLGVWGPPS